jgi:acyl-coenzyme A synthetase/AMP-(fatty) acid ligase
LLLGVTAVIPDVSFPRPARVDPQGLCEAIRKFQVETLFASPVVLDRMARFGSRQAVLLPSLKKVITAGAPAPVPVLESFQKMLPLMAHIFGIYGATEALPMALIDCRDVLDETRFATARGAGICVGKPAAGMQVQIMTITDTPVPVWQNSLASPAGEVGEIVVAGPAVTASYVGPAGHNLLAKMTAPDGSLMHRTGDVGWMDGQGRLWYCGRKSQRVETDAGVYFTEAVEGIFNAHPDVYRTALVGVAQDGQTIPMLWVELKSRAAASQVETIKRQLLELGAQQKMTRAVKTILFRKSFPTDVRHNSKIIREKLALAAQEEFK